MKIKFWIYHSHPVQGRPLHWNRKKTILGHSEMWQFLQFVRTQIKYNARYISIIKNDCNLILCQYSCLSLTLKKQCIMFAFYVNVINVIKVIRNKLFPASYLFFICVQQQKRTVSSLHKIFFTATFAWNYCVGFFINKNNSWKKIKIK